MLCIIFGAAPERRRGYIRDYLTRARDPLIVTADGGLSLCLACGAVPHVHIGDNDSHTGIVPEGVRVISLPKHKDETDMKACLDYALDEGATEFWIFGGCGGRLDHFLANTFLLEYLHMRGGHGTIIDADNEITYHPGGILPLPHREDFAYVSLLALDMTVSGVTEQGLEYSLDNATLLRANPIGVSNAYVPHRDGLITTGIGQALIVHSGRVKKRGRRNL